MAHMEQRETELHQINADNPNQPPEQVIKMAAAMNTIGLISLLDMVNALLHYAFQGKTVEHPQELTATQRTVLIAIALNEAAWTFSGNMNNLLRPLFPSEDRKSLLHMREFIRQQVRAAE